MTDTAPDIQTLIRHTLATLAYRAARPLREAPDDFATFRAGSGTRTPLEIVAHMGDLIAWALTAVRGQSAWHASTPTTWAEETDRFFTALAALDAYFASGAEVRVSLTRLYQGPLADALTHVGQLSLLRGLAGAPVRGENYVRADIAVGRVTREQALPVLEF